MDRLLVIATVLSAFIALVNCTCRPLPSKGGFDLETFEVEDPKCVLPGGTVKMEGEKWTDEEICENCECGQMCCFFGFAMADQVHIEKDGELCVAKRTGDCNSFKYVMKNNPEVDC